MQIHKTHLAIAVMLIATAVTAQDNGAALLSRAAAALPRGPLAVHGTVTLYAGRTVAGDYTLLQTDADHWREQVQFPGYAEIRAAAAPKLFVSRNAGAQPLFFWALFRATHPQEFLRTAPEDRIASAKERKIHGRPAVCARITAAERRDVCIDAANSALLTVTTGPGLSFEYEYAQGNSAFPSAIRISEQGRHLLDATMTIDPPMATAPDLTAPPSAREFGWCSDQVPATIANKTPPHYPENARQNRVQGTSSIYAIIEADGTLSGLSVVQPAGKELDQATLNAVKQWKYRPATCNGTPARVETVISVNYALSP